ncbi:MAG: EAL domain-containing protein, partial [Proteobacteria bacterium]|nr:EAL domain-containing protein [Pseudomonadota bacterium]
SRLQASSDAGSGVQSSYEDLAARTRIGHLVSGYSGLGGLDSIDLHTPKGVRYHIGEANDASDETADQLTRYMAQTLASQGRTIWYGVEKLKPTSNSRKVIVAAKSISRIDASGAKTEPVGMLLMNYSAEYLHDHFNTLDLGTGAYLLLVDTRQRLLFHPDSGLVGQPVATALSQLLQGPSGSVSLRLGDDDVLLSYLQIPDKQWYLLSIVPEATLTAPMQGIQRTGVALLLASLLLIGLFIRIYTRHVVEPIRAVTQGFRDFQANRLDPQWRLPKSAAWVQIGELTNWFNSFLDSMQVRKRAEEDLRIAAAAFDSQEGMVVTDGNNVILRVNQAFSKITGYTLEEAVGRKMNLLKSNRHDAQFYAAIWKTIFSHGAWHGEIWNRVKNGEEHPHWLTISAVRDSNDVVTHYVGTYTDITESKRAEAEILATRNRLQATFDAIPDLLFEAGLDGRIYHYHSPRSDLLAAPPEVFLGKLITEVLPPDVTEVCLAALREASEKGWSTGRSYALDLPQGKRWFELSVAPMHEALDKHFILLVRDITERKAAEDQLRKLSLAVEQSPESIVITDLDCQIEYVNEAFVQKTGYSRQEAIGNNPRMLHSGQTPPGSFAALWETLGRGQAWDGEFHNRRKDGSEYIEHAVITPIRQADGSITHYVAVKEDITARKAAEDKINTLAFFDPLTSLPNRRLLLDRLQQALASTSRSKRYGALLFIDLDNFKTLNDTLGHDIGDLLLQQVAQRLATCVREGDTVARLGGDEFVVMLEDLSENDREAATQTETVGEKILLTLNQHYQLASYPHHSTPSIGVALFADQHETVDDLLKRADMAMYQAKAAGRNTLRFFDPEMQAVVTRRAALEADLRVAILQDQFLLYYQAQVVDAGRLTGAEALLRWRHPERGIVSPAEFIPLAEDTGLILPLGHWVLQTACNQLAEWAGLPEMAHLTIAVNVSPRQFRLPTFVDEVVAILEHHGANPQRLKLELTESLLVEDMEDVISKMSALKAKGVGFSLDDFGTGYSSLSYLKRLPLDQLKIDQGFVRDILTDPNDAAIAKMVVALAGSMGLAVIAEGVEIEAQRDFLEHHGCHAYQGYLFSRPLPLGEFEEFARRV